MNVQIRVHENEPPIVVTTSEEFEATFTPAINEACSRDLANIVILQAPCGDELSIAVGKHETVLGFTSAGGNPPYNASKGTSNEIEPLFTAFVSLRHHTEFPRKYVIPWAIGINAAREFAETGERPTSIAWQEV